MEQEDLFGDTVKKLKEISGQELTGGMQKSKTRLAKDDRGAWINHMADQCFRKEKVDTPPVELDISKQDIIKELVQRKIRAAFGG